MNRKRVLLGGLAALVAEVMSFSVAGVQAEAAEQEMLQVIENPDSDEELQFVEGELDLPENDELFSGYVENVFNHTRSIFKTGQKSSRRDGLNDYEKRYYDAIVEKVLLIADGKLDSSYITVPFSTIYPKTRLTAADLGVSAVVADGKITQEAHDALENMSVDFSKVLHSVKTDFPYEMYWSFRRWSYSGGMRTFEEDGSYEKARIIDDNTLEIRGSDLKMRIYVSRDYSLNHESDDTTDLDVSVTGAAKRAVVNAADIVSQADGKTDYDKLLFYRDKICELVSYDYEAYNGNTESYNPWQMIWAFDNDPSTNVVCEGYSKAFKYLCDNTQFSSDDLCCNTVSGKTDGPHMWNLVHMPDGKNYLVDVTHYDTISEPYISEPDEDLPEFPNFLFLAGSTKREIADNEFICYWLDYLNISASYTYDRETQQVYSEEELTLADRDYDPNAGGARAFVRSLYQAGLGREPEDAGLNDWTDMLISGQKNAVDIVQGVLCSPEYLGQGKSNGQMVTDCYNAMLNRGPDEEGYKNWVSNLDSGMSINAIFAGFVGSQEFGNLCGQYGINPGTYELTENRDKNAGVTKFVSRLYTEALGRRFDEGGLNDWCGQIIANPSRDNILSVATNGFFHSAEFVNKGLNNTEFVKVCYRTYLGREYDEAGLNDWVGQLESGEKSRDQVMEGFAYSEEFSNIMAGYGL